MFQNTMFEGKCVTHRTVGGLLRSCLAAARSSRGSYGRRGLLHSCLVAAVAAAATGASPAAAAQQVPVIADAVTAPAHAAAALTTGVAQADGEFSDMSSKSWHVVNAIKKLNARGVFDGTLCGRDKFCPDEEMQRWVAAVWLVRIVDNMKSPTTETTGFTDVYHEEWWAPFVDRLTQLGITRGCKAEPRQFCPDAPVTRKHMASFLVRAFKLEPAASAGFVDVAPTASQPDIDAITASGLTAGCAASPMRYCPDRTITRYQMAIFLARAAGLLDSAADTPRSFSDVSAGGGHSCGLRTDGTATCWGQNHYGEANAPAEAFTAISAGQQHSCGLLSDGGIECWGSNDDGQTDSPPGSFTSVSAGYSHTCGVLSDSDIKCWGRNDDGQTDSPSDFFMSVSAGGYHSCGLLSDGGIECWGQQRRWTDRLTARILHIRVRGRLPLLRTALRRQHRMLGTQRRRADDSAPEILHLRIHWR